MCLHAYVQLRITRFARSAVPSKIISPGFIDGSVRTNKSRVAEIAGEGWLHDILKAKSTVTQKQSKPEFWILFFSVEWFCSYAHRHVSVCLCVCIHLPTLSNRESLACASRGLVWLGWTHSDKITAAWVYTLPARLACHVHSYPYTWSCFVRAHLATFLSTSFCFGLTRGGMLITTIWLYVCVRIGTGAYVLQVSGTPNNSHSVAWSYAWCTSVVSIACVRKPSVTK